MENAAIEVKNLNVYYKSLQSYSIKQSLLKLKKTETKMVHAVNDVSFSIEKGRVVGIVGKNGSGKSTLLRTLAGIFAPDSGEIDLHGNSISLLALGGSFQKEVSGRENILLTGLLLGFSEKEIREKMDAIIEFSELGRFIDMPVKTYSSGMNSKLSFSVTAILETDIILVDEALSVGDTKFRKKSYAKMRQLIEDESRTALIVSHQENTLKDLCDSIIWLHEGKIRTMGDAIPVLDEYMNFMK